MRRESGTGYHPGTGPTYIETVRSSAWRSRGLLLLTATLLAAVLGLNTSAAQTPCPLTDLGALDEFPSVDGRLEPADCADPFDIRDYADRYEFRLTRADRVTIDLTSRDFNAYLRLLDAGGNQIERDNNGGDGRHSRITRTLSAGRYQLVATEASRGTASGAYAAATGDRRLQRRGDPGTAARGGQPRPCAADARMESRKPNAASVAGSGRRCDAGASGLAGGLAGGGVSLGA